MEKETTKEVLTSTTLEEELSKGHKYGSGYQGVSMGLTAKNLQNRRRKK